MDKIIELVAQDPLRVKALDAVAQLKLPQCYIAAGFVRNLVWDHLHQFAQSTPLNDVDVIYFDDSETDVNRYLAYEEKLKQLIPQFNWQVRNQAKMHLRNNDVPYLNSLDAMRHWPEQETAVAIRKTAKSEYECIAAFGFESLFALQVTHNPLRPREVFDGRVENKGWLKKWPLLKVVN
ncbi:nucleotidyltransferase family protein [Psychrobium sp. MM17-31]|uniref:nucleotidyltransferase family protein n=1 Tax=Psychrobium sp. MM17-31 TaxID=2917758 RepID=UPI001EF4C500|nr:nucleotidyltransferase family protein [Psychrobium sp. MM17-31]MCG7531410.1 nucleotidyltransferase family protein [Psychrobium sp. MM17-31]